MTDAETEIVLIRHGETTWNAEGRIQGHLDIPLNEVGIQQADALAKRLHAEGCDVIYSSDLQRAALTAARLSRPHGLSVVHDVRLRERHLGVLQRLTRDEALARQRTAWESFKRRQADEVLEGGETLQTFSNRVYAFLCEVCERHAAQRIVIVTHGGVMDVAYRLATGRALDAPRDFPLLNTAVNVLAYQGQWRVKTWGDVSHLAELEQPRTGAVVDFIDYAGEPAIGR